MEVHVRRFLIARMHIRKLALTLLTLIAALPLFAEKQYGGVYVMVFMPDDVPFTKGKYMMMTTNEAVVEDDGHGGVRIGGKEWTADRFLQSRLCTAVGTHIIKDQNHVRMVLNCYPLPQIHLFVDGLDDAKATELFNRFIARGQPPDDAPHALRAKIAERAASSVFAGELASIPGEKQSAAMKSVAAVDAVGVKRTIYRDAPYLDINLGDHKDVFNTIKQNRTQRVARVISDRMLPALRTIEEGLRGIDGIAGVALSTKINFKNFVTPMNSEAGTDTMELFVPRAQLKKLIDDEITGQQLIAASVVRVNGTRVDVDLSQQ